MTNKTVMSLSRMVSIIAWFWLQKERKKTNRPWRFIFLLWGFNGCGVPVKGRFNVFYPSSLLKSYFGSLFFLWLFWVWLKNHCDYIWVFVTQKRLMMAFFVKNFLFIGFWRFGLNFFEGRTDIFSFDHLDQWRFGLLSSSLDITSNGGKTDNFLFFEKKTFNEF